jgi:hypothetical protein
VKLIGDAWKLINPGSREIDILKEPIQVTELLDYCVGSDVYAFSVEDLNADALAFCKKKNWDIEYVQETSMSKNFQD